MKLKSFVVTGTVGLLASSRARCEVVRLGLLFGLAVALDLARGGWGSRRGCTCCALDYCCIYCRADNVVLWDA